MEEVNEMLDARSQCLFSVKESAKQERHPNWKVTAIIRGTSLIVNGDGLLDRCKVAYNLSFCSPDGTTKGACGTLTSFFRAPEVIVLFARQTATHRRLSVTQRCPRRAKSHN